MALQLDRVSETEDVKRYARVVAKAWMDPEYKARLVADPRPVLTDAGLELPDGIAVRITDAPVTSIEAVDGEIVFGLPQAPRGGLGDEHLTVRGTPPRGGTGPCGCSFSSSSQPGPHTTACVHSNGHTGPFACG